MNYKIEQQNTTDGDRFLLGRVDTRGEWNPLRYPAREYKTLSGAKKALFKYKGVKI